MKYSSLMTCARQLLLGLSFLSLACPTIPLVAQGADVTYFGLRHVPLGGAVLSLVSNELVVANIGSSGEDGFEIDLTPIADRVHGWGARSAGSFNAGDFAPGSRMTTTFFGTISNVPNRVVGSSTFQVSPDSTQMYYQWDSPYLDSLTAVVVLSYQGEEINRIAGYQGTQLSIPSAITCADQKCDSSTCTKYTVDCPTGGGIHSATGELLGFADYFEISWFGERPGFDGLVTRVRITGVGLGTARVAQETMIVEYSGLKHWNVEQSFLRQTGSTLMVTNFGASRSNGVAVTFDDVQQFSMRMSPLTFGATNDAAWLFANGTFGTKSNAPLGIVSFRQTSASQLGVAADFTAVGAGLTRIEVFRAGLLVGGTVVPGATVGTLSFSGPISVSEWSTTAPFNGKLTWRSLWTPFLFTASNGLVWSGDELRIIADNATNTVFGLKRAGLATSASQIEILSEEVETTGLQLHAAKDGNNVVLSWSAIGARLLAGPTVSGPWTEIAVLSNPVTISTAGSSRFFRLVVP